MFNSILLFVWHLFLQMPYVHIDVELRLRAFNKSFVLVQRIPSSRMNIINCSGTYCFLFIDLLF